MKLATKIYDSWTALGGGLIALVSPGRAAGFRTHRNMYRSYVSRSFVSGEASGMDRNFLPRLRTADADIKRGLKLTVARCRDQVKTTTTFQVVLNASATML